MPAAIAYPAPRCALELALKRGFDVVVSGAALVLLAPLLLVVSVSVWCFLGRPVFYRQSRPGKGGVVFRLWKFRTMTEARDPSGGLLPDAERLSPFSLWLRRSSLDELPQLLNVLVGDMSLVGPRPLLVRYLPRYSARQRLRLAVRPGITGWAQVHGRNAATWAARLEADAWYVEHWSFWLDLRILVATVLAVLSGRDALAGGGAELEEFWGEAGPPSQGPRAYPVEADERPSPGVPEGHSEKT